MFWTPGGRSERSDAINAPAPELIETRIEAHDSTQFEVKLDYTIDPAAKKSRYQIDAYFFVPRSLGINPNTYGKDQFYSDIQAYIRFKTPSVSLGSILDPEYERSPLNRIERLTRALLNQPKSLEHADRLDHELRMLGCLMRVNVRDRVLWALAALRNGHHGAGGAESCAEVARAASRLVEESREVLRRLRALRPAVVDPQFPVRLREVFGWVDEYLSLVTESFLTDLVGQIDSLPAGVPALAESRASIKGLILEEREHRDRVGLPAVLAGPDDEYFFYRRGLLKKFINSVLFLEINKEKKGARWFDVAAGFAAGVAMLISTLVGIWSQRTYGIDSFPFVAALVVAYVFKDRIKDWLKSYLSRNMARYLSDYDVEIRDPVHRVSVGRCREAVTFISEDQVPPEVWNKRHAQHNDIAMASHPEAVIKYSKVVQIHSSVIGDHHGRLADINDIIRFNIRRFTERTDNPLRRVRSYNKELDVVEELACPKVYHINIVFALRAQVGRAVKTIERVRVVLDKNGIRRLEEV